MSRPRRLIDMLTQGRIRVVAIAIADIICVVSVWAVVAYGYWCLGEFMRAHGWPQCPWGGYSLDEYLRKSP